MVRFPTAMILLVAAWFCANRPQAGVVFLLHWLEGGVRFSHQEQLAHGLQAKLAQANQADTDATALAQGADQTAPKPAAVNLVGVTRIEFALWADQGLVPPEGRNVVREARAESRGDVPRDVPVPVPRDVIG